MSASTLSPISGVVTSILCIGILPYCLIIMPFIALPFINWLFILIIFSILLLPIVREEFKAYVPMCKYSFLAYT